MADNCPNTLVCCDPYPWQLIESGIIKSLSGLIWSMAANPPGSIFCQNPAPVTAQLLADPLITYQVTIRIRGVFEQKAYIGGTPISGSGGLFIMDPTFDPHNLANTYALITSNPAHTYYINGPFNWGAGVHDYTVTIPIVGNALVTMTADAVDGEQTTCPGCVVTVGPLDPPILVAQPFDGEFAQMDVVSIV